MSFRAALDRAIDPGVTERPPVPGWRYVAFVLHPPAPGPITLAIAHAEGHDRVLDVIRDGLTIDESAALLRRYGIDSIVGAEDAGDGLNLAHAALGALHAAGRT